MTKKKEIKKLLKELKTLQAKAEGGRSSKQEKVRKRLRKLGYYIGKHFLLERGKYTGENNPMFGKPSPWKGKHPSKKTREKISEAAKRNWQDPEYVKKVFARISPNRSELELLAILNELFPGEYKFVGDGQLVIGGCCPDFTNVNGQKKLVEYNGERWHKKRRQERGIPSERAEDDKRKRLFAKYGYQVCIVHTRELKRRKRNYLKVKLIKFHSQ